MFNFNYDPQRQGYDTSLWKTLSGTPAASGDKLRFNSASAVQYGDCLRGTYKFLVNNPTATTGSDKEFGLTQLSSGAKLSFKVVDDKLRCYVVSADGTSEYSEMDWDTDWTGEEVEFRISWNGQSIVFFVADEQIAVFDTDNNPRTTMSLFVDNNDADNLDFGLFDAQGLESYL